MKIRTKLLLTILPLLAATAIVTAVVTSASARIGMTRLSLRFSSYKAEQLSGYMRSQWDLLLDNGFASNRSFVDAAQGNVAAYAMGLIRRPSEVILAVDASGKLAMQTASLELVSEQTDTLFVNEGGNEDGWVDLKIDGIRYVGHTFYFVPFRWQAFVLERHSDFFAEIRKITIQGIVVLAIVLIAGTVVTLLMAHYISAPVGRVVTAMKQIGGDTDTAIQVPIDYPDEIGELAHQFNNMTDDLASSYERLKTFAFREALARKQIVVSERETLVVLARAAEYRDPETGAHISRVGQYARLVASGLAMDEYRQNLVYYASPLHDIGKLGVPDSILLKPGKLNEEEWQYIYRHPTIAYEVLKDATSPYLKAGAVIALTHHEHFDGKGYPQGLIGEEIPLFGRIVGLVDVFDALTTRRPYKDPWPFDKAVELLVQEKNRHFDRTLVDVFLDDLDAVEKIHNDNPG